MAFAEAAEPGRWGFLRCGFCHCRSRSPAILIIDVKGGQIEQRDGRWYQNGYPLTSSPFDQAFLFRKILLERVSEKGQKPPTIGVATCYPDTFFEK